MNGFFNIILWFFSKTIKGLNTIKNLIKLPKAFNWLYSHSGYYCLKSGLFLDHYFKDLFNKITKQLFLFYGLIFLDNFIINKLFVNTFTYLSTLFYKVYNLKKNTTLSHLKLTIIFLFIFCLATVVYLF